MNAGIGRIARVEHEVQRILAGLADRGEAKLGSLVNRGRQNELGLRVLALRERAERTGLQALERFGHLRGQALGRIGLASAREITELDGQLRLLAARVEKLSRQERSLRTAGAEQVPVLPNGAVHAD